MVHEPDRRGARVAGPGEGADRPLAGERVLEPLVVDVAVEHRGDRLLEDDRDQLGIVAEQPLDLARGSARAAARCRRRRRRAAGRGSGRRRRRSSARPSMSGSAKPCARRCAAVRAPIDEAGVRAAVGERAPEVRVGRGDPVAVALELELGDHHRVEQADDVGAGADHEALVGERALERAGAAELLAALEHEHRAAGPGEVGGGGEPVVAAADDDRVPVARGELGDRRRQADAPKRGVDVGRGSHGRPAREVRDAGELLRDLPQPPAGVGVAGAADRLARRVGAPRELAGSRRGRRTRRPRRPGAVAA